MTNLFLRSPMAELQLDSHKTALVLIDLQNAIVGMSTAPHPAPEVVANSAKLAEAFRVHGAPVVYVRVDLNDFLELPVDQPINLGNALRPGIVSEIAPSAGFQPGDILLTKRHWGAFAGTDLEQQLKSRGVDTVVLTGISTNAGVESTARQGTGLGFGFVVVEDACSGQDGEQHRFAFEKIFPRLCRVRSTNEVLAALTQSDIQRERVQRNRIPRRKDKSRGDTLPKTENRFFPAAGAASAAVVDPARRTTHPNLILAICCMSLLIVGMDVTIVNVALPAIQKDLHARLAGLQWILDAYTLVVASFLMLAGSMSDRFGRRRVFQIGLAVFTIGLLL